MGGIFGLTNKKKKKDEKRKRRRRMVYLKGILIFYNGIESRRCNLPLHIAKLEKAYSRRWRNFIVFNHIWKKNQKSLGGRIGSLEKNDDDGT
ncbi:hypothetical protein G4B88_012125 [Cannabis sativa]|uniref:Uncharacterized protein n=1 Tax=Cannabis sativa TaxID=3483 RepID=A0A7J6F1G7_CANSA|nr:hypothetical protein G4B88_012125 [Cannabis sativa]